MADRFTPTGPVEIIIDSRLRLRTAALTPKVVAELERLFSHANPKFYKLKKMGYKAWQEKPVIRTHRTEMDSSGVEWLTLPRGGMRRLRGVLSAAGLTWVVTDRRTEGDRKLVGWDGPIPEHRVDLWEHQVRIVESVMSRENCVVRSGTGCITGDAMIGINRAGKGAQVRLDRIVKMHNGGSAGNKRWDLTIPTMVRARMDDGEVRLVQLIDAYESGLKYVFEVRFATGHRVCSTTDHQYLTADGWKRLIQLTVGDLVYVETTRRPVNKSGNKKKPWYKIRVVKYHPYAGRKNVKSRGSRGTVPLHRLVMEAAINGIDIDAFIERCNNGAIGRLVFLDTREWAVHHIDENHRNDDISNLSIMSHGHHLMHHSATGGSAHIGVRTILSKVISISFIGARKTYDLSLEAPHNFIANGVVVHNSGKTTALLAAISRAQVPALVIVWEKGLMGQWLERIEKELGLSGRQVGIIKGGLFRLRPVTVAMQQSLYRLSKEKWAIVGSAFGFLGADELSRFAAKSFQNVIDHFPARYRIGMSADEQRKDGKEFLIYDMFGQIEANISAAELAEKGIVHEVEVRVVPSDFRAPWYLEQRDTDGQVPDFGRLLDEMKVDQERNRLIVSVACESTVGDRQALVFAHRVEHCRRLDAAFTGCAVRSGLMVGEEEAAYNATVAGIRDKSVQIGVGTFSKIGLGLDLPAVAAGVVATPCHNNRPFFTQVSGRLSRTAEGKTDALLYYIWDRHVYGLPVLYNLRRWNRSVLVRRDSGDWIAVTDYLAELKGKGKGRRE